MMSTIWMKIELKLMLILFLLIYIKNLFLFLFSWRKGGDRFYIYLMQLSLAGLKNMGHCQLYREIWGGIYLKVGLVGV